jgi:hypothetical protein
MRMKGPDRIHTSIAKWSLTKEPKTHDGKKTASSTNAAGKLDICM